MIEIYKTAQTVFNLKDLAIILNEPNYDNLKSKISYYVKKNYLFRIRKGIFVKENFNKYELACKIYTPSYISFETVLAMHGIIYQYSEKIYLASYLSREIDIEFKGKKYTFVYRKLKDEILYNHEGLIKKKFYTIATPKRAIKDMLYLKKDFYFDNLKNYESILTQNNNV